METALRILVVDGHRDSAELSQFWFEREGHRTRVAATAKEALLRARVFRPDIALVDIGLPDRDGIELARELRRELPSIYVAAITAWVQLGTPAHVFDAGCDHFLLKPATANKLRLMLWHAEARRTGRPGCPTSR